MNKKGGRTATTWHQGSSWNSRETTVIRVPVILKDKILAYARKPDTGKAVLHGNTSDIVIGAIADYIIYRAGNRHANQHSKALDVNSRTWDELRKFAKLVEEQPQLLGLDE